jgi:hypothetical protein
MGSYSSQCPRCTGITHPEKQQKPPRGGSIASVSVVQRDRSAVNRDGSTRLLLQYFKCVSWARFCASSYGNTRAPERAAP